MKVVVAGSYMEFMDWVGESGLDREECYYLAPYAHITNKIPMIESKDDLVYVGTYKENIDWPKMYKEVLVPMCARWKEYWENKSIE